MLINNCKSPVSVILQSILNKHLDKNMTGKLFQYLLTDVRGAEYSRVIVKIFKFLVCGGVVRIGGVVIPTLTSIL